MGRIEKWIKEQVDAGHSLEEIKNSLQNHGYNPSIADRVIRDLNRDLLPREKIKRPRGITIICIFGFVVAILNLFGAILSFYLYKYTTDILSVFKTSPGGLGFMGLGLGNYGLGYSNFFLYLGLKMVIFGVIGLVSFYLLFKMKKWGWISTTLLGIVVVILGIISFNIMSLVIILIWIGILFYLWKKRNLFFYNFSIDWKNKKLWIVLFIIIILISLWFTYGKLDVKTKHNPILEEKHISDVYNQEYYERNCQINEVNKIVEIGALGRVDDFNSGNVIYTPREELINRNSTHFYDICSNEDREFDKKSSIFGNVGIYFDINKEESKPVEIKLKKDSNSEGEAPVSGFFVPIIDDGTFVITSEKNREEFFNKCNGYSARVEKFDKGSNLLKILLLSYDIHAFDINSKEDDVIGKNIRKPMSHDMYKEFFAYTHCNFYDLEKENCINSDIYLYNFNNGETKKISSKDTVDWSPKISERYIVYNACREYGPREDYVFSFDSYGCSDMDIGIYDIKNEKNTILETDGFNKNPKIFKNYLVWNKVDKPGFNKYSNIFLYDIESKEKKKITNEKDRSLEDLSIYGNYVVWKVYGKPIIKYYNISNQKTSKIVLKDTKYDYVDNPKIWNDIIVFNCGQRHGEGLKICYYKIQ